MRSISRIPIVIFAQVPPPEHGQSRMVALALESLRARPETFEVHHVNARFSESLEDIGESSLRKGILILYYLAQAIRLRFQLRQPLLYYVPGPVKWSSVIRDWILLAVLRLFYRKTVFHWHAIGHGEWGHGSERLKLDGPGWMDRIARKISARVLNEPCASISVSATSKKDSISINSRRALTVCNGIEDPCPDYETSLEPARMAAHRELAESASPCFRILFISHGTVEKGLLDAVEALRILIKNTDPQWRFAITFAGGLSAILQIRFERDIEHLMQVAGRRLTIVQEGYVRGEDKQRCYREHDILLAPSRWESFGLTVLEAMAYGMRIVAAASDGVKGVLPEGHPYLAQTANPVELSTRLLQCCSDLRTPPRVNEGKALRQRFLDLYQIKDFAGNLTKAFLEIGGGRAAIHASGDIPSSTAPPLIGEPVFRAPAAGKPVLQSPTARSVSESVGEEDPVVYRSDFRSSLSDLPKHRNSDLSRHSHKATPETPIRQNTDPPALRICAYLADQNPGYDRSFGISRMSQVVLEAIQSQGGVEIETIISKTSQQAPSGIKRTLMLPWGTRRKWVRLVTDHIHPILGTRGNWQDAYYYPKGYLPLVSFYCRPSVVTIHDTIIQYDEDHYPKWRSFWEYGYWARMLKHTLRQADRILTVSESSKSQILSFMERHRIPAKEITVTYEPCAYEQLPQPVNPTKENYVVHLASVEPHKRTSHLIRMWHEAESQGRDLPTLHLIGSVPQDVAPLLGSSRSIVKRPFLEDSALQAAYTSALALILPSEIEGFGLPALEAYYLGTPVCFVKGTSVEEILGVATEKGGFSLDREESLFSALDEVMAMTTDEVRNCGLKLRETYASDKVATRMISVFDEVKNREC